MYFLYHINICHQQHLKLEISKIALNVKNIQKKWHKKKTYIASGRYGTYLCVTEISLGVSENNQRLLRLPSRDNNTLQTRNFLLLSYNSFRPMRVRVYLENGDFFHFFFCFPIVSTSSQLRRVRRRALLHTMFVYLQCTIVKFSMFFFDFSSSDRVGRAKLIRPLGP